MAVEGGSAGLPSFYGTIVDLNYKNVYVQF